MKSTLLQEFRRPIFGARPLLILIVAALGLTSFQKAHAEPNVSLWDTATSSGDSIDLQNRAAWKLVPTDLFTLEANPPKAASDPGYYGRAYSFKGDAVVENRHLLAVVWATKGRVVIYAKANPDLSAGTANKNAATKVAELTPTPSNTEPQAIRRCEVVRNAADEVVLEVFFSGKASPQNSALISFGKNEIVEVKPSAAIKGIHVSSPIEHGVVPGFIGDDLIFSAANYSSADVLSMPSENLFLGLLKGEENVLVLTWPKGKQQTRLRCGVEQQTIGVFKSFEIDNEGQALYLAALSAPGIWHKEKLTPSFLEKDVVSSWKKPFSARWTTQLLEAGVKTAFAFRESKAEIWRGVPGSYSYPVWFNGDAANYHLSKKIPPKGESIIYFLEGQDTPASISTPVEILKATLGRSMADAILDVPGRRLRTHHRRGADGVRRACTCGATEAIQAVFEAGEEVFKKSYVSEALDDMVFFVQCHVDRIDEYRRFADETLKFLRTQTVSPELKPFVETLEQIAQQIPQEYEVQKENMKSLSYANELVGQTLALTGKKDSTNLKAYMDLLKAWRGMGGAQDYVVAQCHTITRKLFQEAGYGCVGQPKAIDLAQEIRRRCRETLRNPDGYEIWPDYY